MRLNAVLPAPGAPWAITLGGVPDPTGAAFLVVMAGVAGRSPVRYVRIRLR